MTASEWAGVILFGSLPFAAVLGYAGTRWHIRRAAAHDEEREPTERESNG